MYLNEKNQLVLTANEIEKIFYDDYEEVEDIQIVEEIKEGKTRWQQCITLILKYNNKFYEGYCMAGLTEYQDDTFNDQSCNEVEKREIKAYEWVKKE